MVVSVVVPSVIPPVVVVVVAPETGPPISVTSPVAILILLQTFLSGL